MVRVWLRPCAAAVAALGRRAGPGAKTAVLRAQVPRSLVAQSLDGSIGIRMMSTKDNDKDNKEFKKTSMADKFDDSEDLTELPEEVKYLSQQLDDDSEEFEGDDEDEDEDEGLSPQDWAKKFEREVAEWDQEEGEFDDVEGVDATGVPSDVEDDRLYVEMPGYDASLSLAESQIGANEGSNMADPFKRRWEEGSVMSPEMLNWMLPAEKRKPMTKGKTKPWKYFVEANHPDVVELALDVDLLRLFISPTGRIRPRRFTGLTAKQQRKLAQAIKVSRQLALLPYLSRRRFLPLEELFAFRSAFRTE
ncbi:hypothetical protein BBO99_00002921 [Phytophthora kernoviae]|uniref:Ribosomal protein S18 n=2 Tax=Phytophthora kernoviae TaxID=325452 RepID=A0A3R7GU97_9STRA|nr:hypothetical protein G195_004011 [Phytophthora kernoviae 00238/432]KAG2530015.1 hypothetical protein JM18_002431 [Phytophthora kernoviae]RLN43913.1 hypothetical protein BBI17_002870 [Phytophthora kernoviae]RLN82409.1 hypothetical protein BBO99_00002921 [Phytophthora kernoviae]